MLAGCILLDVSPLVPAAGPAWLNGGIAAALLALAFSWPRESDAAKYGLGVVIHGVTPTVTRKEAVKLRAKLTWRGPKATFRYAWSTLSGPSLPSSADVHDSELIIPKEALEAGARYELRLRVEADYDDPDDEEDTLTTEAVSQVSFDVNAPPSGGRCEMSVKWHGPAGAVVGLSAPGWSDGDDQIQYRYFLVRNGKPFRVKNWTGERQTSVSTLARVGDTLQARCEIRDQLGDGVIETSDEVRR